MNRLLPKLCRRLASRIPHPRHRLRASHLIHLHLEECEPELRHLEKILPPRRRRALDIGANYGHYAIELHRFFASVVAFEINPALTSDLRQFDDHIQVVDAGLSSTEGPATLYIPLWQDTLPLVGWASLTRGNCPDVTAHQELAVQIKRLDSFELDEVDFMKIDVEGHEMEVLHGARQTLCRHHPDILIELKAPNREPAHRYLEELGYRSRPLSPLVGPPTPGNTLFSTAPS